MKAGKTNIECNTIVQLKNQNGEFKDLNGAKGEITHTFGFLGGTDYGAIAGIRLLPEYEHLCTYGQLHIFSENEITIVE